jgi:hypothetical protein
MCWRILHIDYYAKCGQARADLHPILVIIAGHADSLNVTMTVITHFEAVRQRDNWGCMAVSGI